MYLPVPSWPWQLPSSWHGIIRPPNPRLDMQWPTPGDFARAQPSTAAAVAAAANAAAAAAAVTWVLVPGGGARCQRHAKPDGGGGPMQRCRTLTG